MNKVTIFSITLIVLSSCTNQELYEAVQHNVQLECQKLPQDQLEQCMVDAGEPYDSYSRKRQEVIGKSQ